MKKKLLMGSAIVAIAVACAWLLASVPEDELAAGTSATPTPSMPQASKVGVPMLAPDASGKTLAPRELTQIQQAFEKLPPEEKKAVQQTVSYMGFMTRLRSILESDAAVHLSPAEVSELVRQVDTFQEENYFSLHQAFQMKVALMRRAYQGAELDGQTATLKKQFEQQYAALKERSDPRKDPTFVAFKKELDVMVEQANRMSAYPDRLTREQYIVRESEKIRARHYRD